MLENLDKIGVMRARDAFRPRLLVDPCARQDNPRPLIAPAMALRPGP